MTKSFTVPLGFIVAISMLPIACSPSEEYLYDDLNVQEAERTHLFQISDQSLPEGQVFGNINQLLIAEDGTILILDGQQRVIHLFDSNGNFIATELSEGEGPGEVRQIGRISISTENDILLFDWSQSRLSQYELVHSDQTKLRHIRDLNTDYYPRDFHMSSDGTLYITEYPSPVDTDVDVIKVFQAGENGELNGDPVLEFEMDQVMEIRGEDNMLMATTSSPHHRRTLFNFYDDRLIVGNSLAVGFEIYDLITGEKSDSVGFARPELPLTDAEKRQFIEDISEQMGIDGMQISNLITQMPDDKGKVQTLHYDPDGVIWLYLIGDDEEIDESWLAVDENGKIMGKIIEMPEGHIMKAHSGRLYQLSASDTGEQVIEVYSYNF